MQRRRFLARAGGAAVLATGVLADAPSVIAQPKAQWRMSTAWPKQLDIMQGSANRLGKVVEEMSGGRFRIEVFPGGQIMEPFDCFEAASLERIKTEFKGKVELVQFPAPVLRDLKKIATEVIRAHSEKSPMAKKVYASFTRFQEVLGPWDHVAEGVYHQVFKG